MFEVELTKPARADFVELLEFLRTVYSQKAAKKLKAEFAKLLQSLKKLPFRFPKVIGQSEIRKVTLLAKTVVFYEVTGNLVTILSVRDGRRQNLRR